MHAPARMPSRQLCSGIFGLTGNAISLQRAQNKPANERPRSAKTPTGEYVGWVVYAKINPAEPDKNYEQNRYTNIITPQRRRTMRRGEKRT